MCQKEYILKELTSEDKYRDIRLYLRKLYGTHIQMRFTEKGKPSIIFSDGSTAFCSFTDTQDYSAWIFSRSNMVGLDIEQMNIRSNAFYNFIGSVEEYSILEHYIGYSETLSTLLWTMKEAAQKADKEMKNINRYYLVSQNNRMIIWRNYSYWNIKIYFRKEYVLSLAYKCTN